MADCRRARASGSRGTCCGRGTAASGGGRRARTCLGRVDAFLSRLTALVHAHLAVGHEVVQVDLTRLRVPIAGHVLDGVGEARTARRGQLQIMVGNRIFRNTVMFYHRSQSIRRRLVAVRVGHRRGHELLTGEWGRGGARLFE